MFQRIKGAFDSIAEEQARQRTQQQQSTPRRTSSTTRSASQTPRPTRPRRVLEPLERNTIDSKEQEPDPDSFDAEFTVADDEERPSESHDQNITSTGRISEGTGNAEKGDSASGDVPSEEHNTDNAGPQQADELPVEVKSKLRRLNKLEVKYQGFVSLWSSSTTKSLLISNAELLKAYRKAHSRNSAIEPFEARLRETTPLTSISDPAALVEYLNQLNLRGDMVMQELRKTSQERDELKKKVLDAEQQTKEALDEVTQLREQTAKQTKSAPTTDSVAQQSTLSAATNSDLDAKTSRSPSIASPKSMMSLFSPKRHASEPVSAEEPNEEFFSIDSEVPRLQDLLASREQRIETLESDIEACKRDLSTAEESAGRMINDLENKQSEVESLRSSNEDLTSQAQSQHRQREASEKATSAVRTKLKDAENRLQSTERQMQVLKDEHERQKAIHANVEHNGTFRETSAATEVDGSTKHDRLARFAEGDDADLKQGEGQDQGHDEVEAPPHSIAISEQSLLENGVEDHLKAQKSTLEANLASCLSELQRKDAMLSELRIKCKAHEDLTEEVETLKDELLSIGQEHVEAKEKIKQLEGGQGSSRGITDIAPSTKSDAMTNGQPDMEQPLQDKLRALNDEITGLKEEQAKLESGSTTSEKTADLMGEIAALKEQSQRLRVELPAAQELAASRYKEITSLKAAVQKDRKELAGLRSELEDTKVLRAELEARNTEVRKLESKEANLEAMVSTLKQKLTEREGEIKTLSEKARQEGSRRLELEESHRKLSREAQRNQSERAEALANRAETAKRLSESETLAKEARAQLSELQAQVGSLSREAGSLRDEIALKTAQHASAQSLMSSVRDQATEMATQLKEARGRCESLEEELNDVQRLMNERAREGETMRRMLSEVESRATARVKDIRERMETATQDRDRAEEEASMAGRRRAREVDELKSKLRDMERDLAHALEEKAEIQRLERELRRQQQEDSGTAERSKQEVSEIKNAMSELRDALDEGERQARVVEAEKTDLKRLLDETQARLDKMQRSHKSVADELRSQRAIRIRPMDSGAQSSRSSVESNRPGQVASHSAQGRDSPKDGTSTAVGATIGAGVDYVYLKNILLQFLEQKDKRHQMQLVPVLGMLLHFDKRDEQKWVTAITAK